MKLTLGKEQKIYDDKFKKLVDGKVIERIWNRDHTVWSDDPTEISNRLGWLDSPQNSLNVLKGINEFVDSVKKEGFTNALLMGMGGSSLAPEVFRFTFGVKDGCLDLDVLDSTDPGAVLEKERKLDFSKTLFIVSTKSGGTVETMSFLKYFYNRALDVLGKDVINKHFIAITDPGSGLEDLAKSLNFRKIFLNDPNIGGRYSALSLFGIVPAALVGIDAEKLLLNALTMADECKLNSEQNSAAVLGAVMGALGENGKDKITFIMSPKIKYFGAWVEQLIAESTGKNGKGILPVDLEEITEPIYYSVDRLFIYMKLAGDSEFDSKVEKLKSAGFTVIEIILNDIYDFGGEFLKWELATVVAGWVLNIQPFDQPNVESAKIVARRMMKTYTDEGKLPELTASLEEDGIKVYGDIETTNLRDVFIDFLNNYSKGDLNGNGRSYVSIQAYIKPSDDAAEALFNLRTVIQKKYQLATTVGFGPRFLHSTGQLHKGDAGNGLFIQFTAHMPEDIDIPENPGKRKSFFSFAVLKDAQALGDRQALLDNKRKFIRFDLGKDVIGNLNKLAGTIK
ncbi:MAG: glucose-6-phosphate isomerase [Bacteroidetes bacterium]|nr:glucose-6-phosphate isomerase [Bacteroidota bacterium]